MSSVLCVTLCCSLMYLEVCLFIPYVFVLLRGERKINEKSVLERETKSAWQDLARVHAAENRNMFFFFSTHVGLLYFKTLRRRRSHSRTHSETMHAASVTSHLIGGRHSRARPKGQDLFTVLLNFQSRREKISLHCHTFLWQHFVLALSLLFMYYSHLT